MLVGLAKQDETTIVKVMINELWLSLEDADTWIHTANMEFVKYLRQLVVRCKETRLFTIWGRTVDLGRVIFDPVTWKNCKRPS
jgi:hypothetical protein